MREAPRGTLVALFWLARPAGTALLLGLPAVGYGMAIWGYAMLPWRLPSLAGVLLAWALLSAGTMWLNAALDGDEGGALFAGQTRRPAGLRAYGAAALVLSVCVATASDRRAGAAAGLCATLSALYSHPRTAWKAHPLLGPLVNALGYGLLSPLAGWSVAEAPMDMRTAAAFASLTLFVLGITFGAQAFQREDDARRGYRTLVVTHGSAACLRAAHALMRASVGVVAILAAAGYYPRLCLAGILGFWWADRWMASWRQQAGGGQPRHAAGFLWRMLLGALALIGLALLDYVRDHVAGEERVAGAATAAGRTEAIER